MKQTELNGLGIRLKVALMNKKISQTKLAKDCEMSDVSISRLIKGDVKDPSAGTIVSICRVLGVSSDYLLGLTDEVTR